MERTMSWSYAPSPGMSPALPPPRALPHTSDHCLPSNHFRLFYYVITTHRLCCAYDCVYLFKDTVRVFTCQCREQGPLLSREGQVYEGTESLEHGIRTSAEQCMARLVEKVDTDCRRDLLWEYLQTGGPGIHVGLGCMWWVGGRGVMLCLLLCCGGVFCRLRQCPSHWHRISMADIPCHQNPYHFT